VITSLTWLYLVTAAAATDATDMIVRHIMTTTFLPWFIYVHRFIICQKQHIYRVSGKVAPAFLHIFSRMGWNFNTTFYTFIQNVYLRFCAKYYLIDFNNGEVTKFLVKLPSDFRALNTRALKSHCYVKITNTINGSVFHHNIFHVYSELSFTFTGWPAWLSGRTSVSGQRSFAVLRSTCS